MTFQERIDEAMASYRERGFEGKSWEHTIGAFVTAVMKIDNDAEARLFFDGYLEWMREHIENKSLDPREVCRLNVGWCFGEGMATDRVQMWQRVADAAHPMLTYDADGNGPGAREALRAGMDAGRKLAQP